MKKNIFLAVVCAVLALNLTGCVSTVDGRSKAGVPWLKDKIESKYERPVKEVTEAARAALKANGTIISDDLVTGTITAKVDTRTVYVKVTEIDKKVTQVLTQVRTKGGGADVDLAAEIDKQIALQLQR
jgi:phage host-nuclease inhibitor protein Gam